MRKPVKRLFSEHGRNLEYSWRDSEGKERNAFFKTNSDWTRKPTAFQTGKEQTDPLNMHVRLRTRSRLGHPCIICESTDGVQMHHVRHIRKVEGKPVGGFAWLMRLQNRKQVPVCQECHRKIHRGEYDGLRLADLAYRVGP